MPAAILLCVVALGFLPPLSIIPVTSPVVLTPSAVLGFDLIWFGVVMTIVMKTGLIDPPFGLNLFAITNIAPECRSATSSAA